MADQDRIDDDPNPFGPEPTEAIFTPFGDTTAGYSEPARWGRRLDGRPVRLGGVQGDRLVRVSCACGVVVMVPYRDGPPLGPLRCEECQRVHDQVRQAACGVARVTTQRKET